MEASLRRLTPSAGCTGRGRIRSRLDRIRPCGDQARVVRRGEIAVYLLMALVALLGTDVLRPGHVWEHDHGAVYGLAGNHRQQQNERAGSQRQAAPPSGGKQS